MESADRLPELDGIRALACLTVVFGHFDQLSVTSFFPIWREIRTTVSGNLGVTCFFTLSGFLLTYLAVLEFHRAGRFDVRAFYIRRVFRIWPLHFTVLAVAMLLTSPIGPVAIGEVAYRWCLENLWAYAIFLNNWSLALRGIGGHIDMSPPMLNISWSIAIEEQIYALFPLVMLGLLGRSWRRFVLVGAGIAGLAFGYRLFAFLAWTPLQSGISDAIYLATPTYFDVVFAGGVAGWLCARRRIAASVSPSAVASTPGAPPGLLVVLGIALACLLWRFIREYGTTGLDVVAYPLMGMAFGAAMLWVVLHPESRGSRLLRTRPLRILGLLSFGLYLWHLTARTLVYSVAMPLRPESQGALDVWAVTTFACYLALSLGMAALSYVAVERPFLDVRRRMRSIARASIRSTSAAA